jgi:hypothetical protein
MAAPQPVSLDTTDLSVHVTATTDIVLPDGNCLRVPVGVPPESAAQAILSSSRSPFCAAPISHAQSLVSIRQNLDAVSRELTASRQAEALLSKKYFALDKEHCSLRLEFLAVDKENALLTARIVSLDGELLKAHGESAALKAEVERLRSSLAESDAWHAAEVERLKDQVDGLKNEVFSRDARVTALEGSVANLTSEVVQLRANSSLSRLEDELSRAGEFASKLETRIVQDLWPGASQVGSPVRFLKDISVFFNSYFDGSGRLERGKVVPKSYHHAPSPMREFLAGDTTAFAAMYARWTTLQETCPAFVDVIGELKNLRDEIAHVQPPPGSSPASLRAALEDAQRLYETSGGAGDERVSRACDALDPLNLNALSEWWPK